MYSEWAWAALEHGMHSRLTKVYSLQLQGKVELLMLKKNQRGCKYLVNEAKK